NAKLKIEKLKNGEARDQFFNFQFSIFNSRSESEQLMGFSTDCIHAGQEPEETTGAVSVPIFQTSTYVQPELGRNKGYEYARTKNPTRSALEANLAALERGKHAHCFASGMSATDIAACADVAHKRGALVVVDNTFCSPYLQRPIELGADIVVHSTTKFLNGHSDSVGGVVVSNSDDVAEKIGFLQNAVGAIL